MQKSIPVYLTINNISRNKYLALVNTDENSLKKSTKVHFNRSKIFLFCSTTSMTSIYEKKISEEARLIQAE